MQSYEVAFFQQCAKIDVLHLNFFSLLHVMVFIVTKNLHLKRFSYLSNPKTNRPRTNYAQSLPIQFDASKRSPIETAISDMLVSLGQSSNRRKQQSKSMLGNRLRSITWNVCDHDPSFLGCLKIRVVTRGSPNRNHLKFPSGINDVLSQITPAHY